MGRHGRPLLSWSILLANDVELSSSDKEVRPLGSGEPNHSVACLVFLMSFVLVMNHEYNHCYDRMVDLGCPSWVVESFGVVEGPMVSFIPCWG